MDNGNKKEKRNPTKWKNTTTKHENLEIKLTEEDIDTLKDWCIEWANKY
jgi:hypothetical protein